MTQKIVSIPLPGGLDNITPTIVVVHAIAEIVIDENGKGHYCTEYMRKQGLSAHLFVTPSGTVIQSREFDQGAWHCRAQGRNYNSMGIEFMVPGAHDWSSFISAISKPYLTANQYEAGVEVCRDVLHGELGITLFEKHSKLDPKRKRDPGKGFSWNKFMEDVLVYKPK
ncbi:N-acetylmuramoyl-L-alanine amidase [Candidatus Pacearchaeota archaeon]|nr:N-acetylmuramoyl-L-alanine amidase [Candidatus Pacearchaeota archaeon]